MSTSRFRALDGLRGTAIILVLLYHLTPGADPNRGVESLVFKVADFGWTGVDLFFVLSGFLITEILLRAEPGRVSLRNFFVRRALRIVPVCYSVLVFVFLVVPLATNAYVSPNISEQWPYWLFLSNYVQPQGSYSEYLELGHLWSLSVEIQYYLLWPCLVISLSVKSLCRIIVAGLVMSVVLRTWFVLEDVDWFATFAWLPMRWDGLLVGSFLALLWNGRVHLDAYKPLLKVLGIVATGVVMYVVWRGLSSAVFKESAGFYVALLRVLLPTLVSIIYGYLLYFCLLYRTPKRVFSNGVLRFFGKYSYAIYVFHFLLVPLFLLHVKPVFDNYYGAGSDAAVYLYFVTTTFVATAMAVASYRVVEKPALSGKGRFPISIPQQMRGNA